MGAPSRANCQANLLQRTLDRGALDGPIAALWRVVPKADGSSFRKYGNHVKSRTGFHIKLTYMAIANRAGGSS